MVITERKDRYSVYIADKTLKEITEELRTLVKALEELTSK